MPVQTTEKPYSVKNMRLELAKLQRLAKEKKLPILIIFEGLDAAGKGSLINELLLSLDPRGYKVFSNIKDTEEEHLRPFFWKFWNHLPGNGEIALFDRSWYYSLLKKHYNEPKKRNAIIKEIINTESMLEKDGILIIKFFLYIDKKTQKKRLEKLESNKSTSWKVSAKDWKHYKQHSKIFNAYKNIINKTDSELCKWHMIDSVDSKKARYEVFEIMINEINTYLEEIKTEKDLLLADKEYALNLDDMDLSQNIEKEIYNKKLKKYQKRLRELEHELYIKRIPLVIGYEGWDAGGKGGNIKRLVQNLDPRGYDVIPIAAPNDIERNHHYLWRFWTKFPKGGHIAIFDRTWYGRVLVERIEGFCSDNEWKRAFQEIKLMERQWTNSDAIVLKFWIHIDKEEQLKRFTERKGNPHKQWKLTDEDWRNREKWDIYKEAIEEMIIRTSVDAAPWHIIEGNSKLHARLKVMEIVIDAIEKKLAIC